MFCKKLSIFCALIFLMGCTPQEMYQHEMVKEAQVTDRTRAGLILEKLPSARDKIAVALYDFQDMTGQFKNNERYSDFSSAVTKGGHSILTKALLDAGNKRWFTVTERSGLKNLLQERQIIKVMRSEHTTPDGQKLPDLPPLVYGGMLLEGGIIGYDSNVVTGGAGAIYLGIGGNTRYARDVITVYLRAVNIQTGEVLMSVTSSKTIFSTAVGANVLKYITFDKLLQAEAGFSLNEPVMLATRQAIETAVYSMIMEGAIEGVWEFSDPVAGQKAVAEYVARRDQQNALPSESEEKIFERAMMTDQVAQAAPVPVNYDAGPNTSQPQPQLQVQPQALRTVANVPQQAGDTYAAAKTLPVASQPVGAAQAAAYAQAVPSSGGQTHSGAQAKGWGQAQSATASPRYVSAPTATVSRSEVGGKQAPARMYHLVY